jgi:hypothetical protein
LTKDNDVIKEGVEQLFHNNVASATIKEQIVPVVDECIALIGKLILNSKLNEIK